MSQILKIEEQIELKCSADKFFNVWAHETHRVSEMVPDKMTKIELHEGKNWHSAGAIKSWHYVLNGRHEFAKTKVTKIDEKNKSVCYDLIDGYAMKNYCKSFKSTIQAIPKGDGGCFVKWSFEYEKKTPDAPDADMYIHLLLACAKDMGAHLCTA